MKFTLDLTQGLTDNDQYKAWKFMGGEIHFVLKRTCDEYMINTRLNSSEDVMLLFIATETIHKNNRQVFVDVFIPYCLYAQADRDFGPMECFSLKSFAKIINMCNFRNVFMLDPHSEMAPTLINNVIVVDNSEFITWVLKDIANPKITWLSPDAGAYKKIGKLANKLGWIGGFAAANKYRNTSTGNIDSLELSHNDFLGGDVLIIDDICMGGRTFVGLAEKLKEHNVGKMYLAVTHMIPEKINSALGVFEKIYFTSSRYNDYITLLNHKIFLL